MTSVPDESFVLSGAEARVEVVVSGTTHVTEVSVQGPPGPPGEVVGGISPLMINAKGDLIVGTANDTVAVHAAGFNGQILTVDTATATGLKWITQQQASAGILASIVDAKGDIIVATGNDSVMRLGIGANGQTLIADSAATGGMRWSTPASPLLASVIDAKGDLLVGSANDTYVRVPVGADGQALTADSTAPSGVRWTTIQAGSGGSPSSLDGGTSGTASIGAIDGGTSSASSSTSYDGGTP